MWDLQTEKCLKYMWVVGLFSTVSCGRRNSTWSHCCCIHAIQWKCTLELLFKLYWWSLTLQVFSYATQVKRPQTLKISMSENLSEYEWDHQQSAIKADLHTSAPVNLLMGLCWPSLYIVHSFLWRHWQLLSGIDSCSTSSSLSQPQESQNLLLNTSGTRT